MREREREREREERERERRERENHSEAEKPYKFEELFLSFWSCDSISLHECV